MDSERKVVIVTGASQGIGAGIVKGYRDRGYRVVATSRSIKESADPDVLTIAGDISDWNTAQRIVNITRARFGRIDSLVNNAGLFIGKPFAQYSKSDFDEVVGVNLTGFFHLTQLAIEEMTLAGSGHVVNITTTLATHALSAVPAAMASLTKGGLNAVTLSLAIEYAARGVRVNAISPGVIKTSMHPESTHVALGKLHPLGRMGEVDEIVSAVMFLETAGFVTGEILHVDGGQSAGH
jgi:NAD(P)-dependent dehydrogenase (short-subunit alcohol dehydrogenase family)